MQQGLVLFSIFGCFMSGFKVVTLKEIPIGKRSPISKFYYSIPSCQRKSNKFSGDIISPSKENKRTSSFIVPLNIKYSKSLNTKDFFADRTLNVMCTVLPNLEFCERSVLKYSFLCFHQVCICDQCENKSNLKFTDTIKPEL